MNKCIIMGMCAVGIDVYEGFFFHLVIFFFIYSHNKIGIWQKKGRV